MWILKSEVERNGFLVGMSLLQCRERKVLNFLLTLFPALVHNHHRWKSPDIGYTVTSLVLDTVHWWVCLCVVLLR
jgi:threonine/homoserine/homoserine lactone efflux protein